MMAKSAERARARQRAVSEVCIEKVTSAWALGSVGPNKKPQAKSSGFLLPVGDIYLTSSKSTSVTSASLASPLAAPSAAPDEAGSPC